MSKFQVKNEITGRPDVCNLLRDHDGERMIFSYSNKTMNLYRAYPISKEVAETPREDLEEIKEIQKLLDE